MMMRTDKLIIILFTGLLLGACSSSDESAGGDDSKNGKKIELSFSVPDYSMNVTTRAGTTDSGSPAEQDINNLYVFLFPTTSDQTVVKYYVDAATFTGGTWSTTDHKVDLDLTQAEAGKRDVYIVANCADLKTSLDAVTTEAGLQAVFRNTPSPWSDHINVPILMSGNAIHDFIADGYQLDNVPLVRAIAKVELNITLSSSFQTVPTITAGSLTEYKYRYVNFDQNTYVVKPGTKLSVTANSSSNEWPTTTDWTQWGSSLNVSSAPDTGAGYTLSADGKVTALKIITYINESDVSGSAIEIELPRTDEGPLPPPEFGPEWYKLPLPDKIERNTWYTYDVDL
jgi:hypothetical protein